MSDFGGISVERLGAGPKAKPSRHPKTASERGSQACPLPWEPRLEGGGADCPQDTVTAAPSAPQGSPCWSHHRQVKGGNRQTYVAARKRHLIFKEAESGVRNL